MTSNFNTNPKKFNIYDFTPQIQALNSAFCLKIQVFVKKQVQNLSKMSVDLSEVNFWNTCEKKWFFSQV